ncbi:hypothetical protein R6Q57_016607 [Mikania cordata]
MGNDINVHDKGSFRNFLKVQMARQQLQIVWKDYHNIALLIAPPPESQKQFASVVHGFETSKIAHALRMNPVIHENLIEEFWLSASIDKEADSKRGAITAQVQNTGIVITEDVIRDVLAFLDKSTDPRGVVTRNLKMLYESTFPLMLQNREGKYIFRGIHPLRKFGQFAEIEEVAVDEPAVPNVNVNVLDDEDVFEVSSPKQESIPHIAIEQEIETVFDVETETDERQVQIDMQQDLFNYENLTALLQSEELVDAVADLAPRKRRRRDPRPGAVVSNSQIPQVQTDTSITAEPTQFEKEQTGPSIKILDYDTYLTREQGTSMRPGTGKIVLPEDEPIDIPRMQRRVSELKQETLSHSIQIEELRTDNAQKDDKIKSLEIDVGHLTAIVLDLKQKLQEKFQGEFIDEPSPNTISASTSTKN